MDDTDQFDYGQLDQLLNIFSSSSSTPPLITTHRKQDSSISLQTQSSNLVTNHHVTKKKSITNNNHVIKEKPIIITTTTIGNCNQDPPKEKEKRKVLRREVERQRRQDMAKLYQRLHLLIPSKYLMVKRSISDHLEETLDYVKDLRKNIEDLERERESLKEMINVICDSQLAPSSSSMKLIDNINGNDDEERIRVNSCNEGVKISVKGGVPLSKVLKVLMKEGLIVNSCVSSTVNQRHLHIIVSFLNS